MAVFISTSLSPKLYNQLPLQVNFYISFHRDLSNFWIVLIRSHCTPCSFSNSRSCCYGCCYWQLLPIFVSRLWSAFLLGVSLLANSLYCVLYICVFL